MSAALIAQQRPSVEGFDAADAAFRDRFAMLRIRTSIVGVSAILGWIAALLGLLSFGNSLAEWFVRLSISGDGVDIPEIMFRQPGSGTNGLALLFAFAAAGLIGIAGHLKRGLRLWELVVWMLVLTALGGAILYSHSRLLLIASEQVAAQPLVRQVRAGDIAMANTFVRWSHPMESQYVLAQMALVKGDEKALKTYTEPLLRQLDRLLLRMELDSKSANSHVPDLRIDVLQRLDLKLYGAPHSQVSLGEAAASGASKRQHWHVAEIVGVVGSMLLAWLATQALVLFHRMVQRLSRLRTWLGIV